METVAFYYQYFQDIMKANPVVAGAVSLWGLTVLTFIIKEILKRYIDFYLIK